MSLHDAPAGPGEALELWAGIDGDAAPGDDRAPAAAARTDLEADIDRLASLGIRRLRLPLTWARIAPVAPEQSDWHEAERCMHRLRERGIAPIAALVQHGHVPGHTGLLNARFPAGLAAHARAVAERFPDIAAYAPLNAPVATARLAMLEGRWHPHQHSDASFVRAVLHQVQATVLAMRAVRAVNPAAVLIQTEDLGLTRSALRLRYHAEFMNLRRWLAIDLLAGRVDRSHRLWRYLRKHGASEAELMALVDAPCRPDLLGLDLQLASDRFLDDRLTLYPREQWSGNGRHRFIDAAAVQVQGEPIGGFEARLREMWQRYGLPLAVTRTQLDPPREAQMHWLDAAWQGALRLREEGAQVRGVMAPQTFGCCADLPHGTRDDRHCMPGLWDLRAPEPRPTALVAMARGLAHDGRFTHPVLEGPGLWQRELRFTQPPHGTVRSLPVAGRPLLVTGAHGMLGQALARVCEQRGLAHRALGRSELDIAEPGAVDAALERWQPWAVINAAGFARVDEAEHDPRVARENVAGPVTLARACARAGVRLVGFSSDQVFDGGKHAPYVESDPPAPLNAYGRAQVEAEQGVLTADPTALVVRTAALFGPWDAHNVVARLVAALRQRRRFAAAADRTVSPTYAPDLAHAVLDLLIDGVSGLLHLAHCGAVTWAEFSRMAAKAAHLDDSLVDAVPSQLLGLRAPRPLFAALATERCDVMPTLEEGIAAFVRDVGRAALAPLVGPPRPAARSRRRAGTAPPAESLTGRH